MDWYYIGTYTDVDIGVRIGTTQTHIQISTRESGLVLHRRTYRCQELGLVLHRHTYKCPHRHIYRCQELGLVLHVHMQALCMCACSTNPHSHIHTSQAWYCHYAHGHMHILSYVTFIDTSSNNRLVQLLLLFILLNVFNLTKLLTTSPTTSVFVHFLSNKQQHSYSNYCDHNSYIRIWGIIVFHRQLLCVHLISSSTLFLRLSISRLRRCG